MIEIVWPDRKNVPPETAITDFPIDRTYHDARSEGREYEAQLTLEATGKPLKKPKSKKPLR